MPCSLMKFTASCTVAIFSASSSEISIALPSLLNSSSSDMISSTRSRESALRSSTKEVWGWISVSSTPSWSAMIFRTRSKTAGTGVTSLGSLSSGREHAHGSEDAVNKLGGVLAAVFLGKLYRFVDGGPHWHLIINEDFVYRKPQDIPVHYRDLVQREGRCRLPDHLVDPLPARQHPFHQLQREPAHLRRRVEPL